MSKQEEKSGKFNYITLANNFWFASTEGATSYEVHLYFLLLHICNQLGWKNPFGAKDATLYAQMGITNKPFKVARERLIQKGLIRYQAGHKGVNSVYELVNIDRTKTYESSKLIGHTPTNHELPGALIGENVGGLIGGLIGHTPNYNNTHTHTHTNKKEERDTPVVFLKDENSPLPEEIDNLFLSNGGSLEMAGKFYSKYQSNGWQIGGSKIKDMPAAVRGYIKRWNEFENIRQPSPAQQVFGGNNTTAGEYKAALKTQEYNKVFEQAFTANILTRDQLYKMRSYSHGCDNREAVLSLIKEATAYRDSWSQEEYSKFPHILEQIEYRVRMHGMVI